MIQKASCGHTHTAHRWRRRWALMITTLATKLELNRIKVQLYYKFN